MLMSTVLVLCLTSYTMAIPTSLNFKPEEPEYVLRMSYEPYLDTWAEFKQEYNKTYDNLEEERSRFSQFMQNVKYIEYHNRKYYNGETTFTMDINHLADLSDDEYRMMNTYGLHRGTMRVSVCDKFVPTGKPTPKHVDWRTKGLVTPVKNQKNCGSCWAFSATGAMEGQWAKKAGRLTSLSEQQIVDCSQAFGPSACGGGYMDEAFTYVIEIGGIETEDEYPYQAQGLLCRSKRSEYKAHFSSCYDIKSGSEEDQKEAVAAIGPISVAIDATYSFRFYKHGVYHDPKCSRFDLDHGVLVVGYGTDEHTGLDYWLVKNSWSERWGDHGYIKMSRNKNNACGIAQMSSFPLV